MGILDFPPEMKENAANIYTIGQLFMDILKSPRWQLLSVHIPTFNPFTVHVTISEEHLIHLDVGLYIARSASVEVPTQCTLGKSKTGGIAI
jgi:hypothetical protein